MKIVGYQIFLRITRFVILVIRPDYQKFCLRSTPDDSINNNGNFFVYVWGVTSRAHYATELYNLHASKNGE